MKKYEVIKPLKLGKGAILELSEQQAGTRKTILQKIGDFYEAMAETQWVAGEVIGLEGEQPPAMLAYLKDLQPEVVEEKPKTGRPRK